MPTFADKIRSDYREAVASAMEGVTNDEAWFRIRQALADGIMAAWLNAAAKEAITLPVLVEPEKDEETGITKDRIVYSKSDESIELDGIKYQAAEGVSVGSDGKITTSVGFIRPMLAQDFLDLAMSTDTLDLEGSRAFFTGMIKSNKPIKQPFMYVKWNDDDERWEVFSHDGRHRAHAIKSINADAKIPVYLIAFSNENGRLSPLAPEDITDEMRSAKHYIPENDGKKTRGQKTIFKRTFAKSEDTFAEFFESLEIDHNFEPGVNFAALDILESRLPIVRSTVDVVEELAGKIANDVVSAEMGNVIDSMEASSNAVLSAFRNAFWVSDVDKKDVINLKKLLADAIRGVLPDDKIDLPEFISRARLQGAANLTDARIETIFRVNLSSAANEGVMTVLRDPVGADLFPLVMLTEIDDDRSRPHHAIMDGYITTVDEIDRLGLRPPNGFNCRGELIKVSRAEATRLGLLDEFGRPDMIAIEQHNTPEQNRLVHGGLYPDPGFKKVAFS